MTVATRDGEEDAPVRRVLLVSHCVLNQNAVVQPLARSEGVLIDATQWALAQGWGIVQLPCPEFASRGPQRAPDDFDGYNVPEFHDSNRRLLGPVIRQLKRYQDAGYEIVGGLHVSGSPSCDPDTGNWVTDIIEAAEAAGVRIRHHWQVPQTSDAGFDPADPATVFGDPRGRRGVPDGAVSVSPGRHEAERRRRAVFLAGDRIPVRSAP